MRVQGAIDQGNSALGKTREQPILLHYTQTNLLHVITVEELPHDTTGLLRFFRVDPVATIIN